MKKLITGLMLTALFTGSLRSQQPQTPSAATVNAGGTTYDWTPYPDNPAVPLSMARAWANENQGSPTANMAPDDTRMGGSWDGISYFGGHKVYTSDRFFEDNCKAVMAGAGTSGNPEDYFVVSIDKPGDVGLNDPVTGNGNALFVHGYQSITLRRIDPSSGSCRSGYPKRLDAHAGVCALPRIIKDNAGNLYIFWRERTAGGDQVMGAHLVVSTNTLDETAQNICGNQHYSEIRELSAATDDQSDHGAAVVMRNHSGTWDDQIYTQRVNVPGGGGAFVREWPDVGSLTSFTMRQVGGSGLLAATGKFCPQIAYNVVKTRYEIAWGDNTGWIATPPTFPTPQIRVQTETISTAPTENYAGGGAVLPTPAPLSYFCEFYMICAKGYLVGPTDKGLTVFYYRDFPGQATPPCTCTGNGLAMNGYLLNATVPTLVFEPTSTFGYQHSVADFDGAWPSGLTTRAISSTQEDVIGVYQTGFTASHYVATNNFHTSTGVVDVATQTYYPTTMRIQGYVSTNGTGTFAVIPDNGIVNVFRVFYGPLSIVLIGQLDTRNVDNPTGNDAPSNFAAALGTNNLGVLNYEYGVDQSSAGWPWMFEKVYANDEYNHETDERPRETDFEPNEYNFTNFTAVVSWPFLSPSAPVAIEDNTFHYNPHTAVYNDHSATVYEELDAYYNSNIILGVVTGINATASKYVLTNCTTGDTCYYQPKVALGEGLGCGTDNFAIVTYISMIRTPWAAQEYCYRIVDLTTGTIGPENVYMAAAFGAGTGYFRNWDVVHDLSSPGFIFIFGEQYSPSTTRMFGGQLDALVFDGCGTYAGTNVLQWYNGNTQDEVRACYDPDLSNLGAYVTWRETPSASVTPGNGATIDLVQINTVSQALWAAGVIQHVPGNVAHRGEPVVAADKSWLVLAWADKQGGGGTSRIWGCARNNLGILFPNSNINGVVLSTSTEAHHPDVIVNPELMNTAMVAWDEDCNGLASSWRNIRAMNCTPFGIALASTTVAITTPHNTPTLVGTATMNDARWSMYGYMQRRPKLIAMDAPSEVWPYDWSGANPNLNHWILCAYECEAYNLYGSGASCSSGGTLAGKYLQMWNDESARPAGPYGGYLQNNIVAKVLNPNLSAGFSPTQPLIGGEMCLAAGANAQDLYNLSYSQTLGPVVGVIDYTNTSNVNGIARAMIARPYYYLPPFVPLAGVWNSPMDSHPTMPLFLNNSWDPMFLHPAVGSPTPGVPPSGTWTVNTASTTMTLNPMVLSWATVDYASPFFINALRVTGHIDHIAGQWPLSSPDWWGATGNVTIPGMGYGLKPTSGSMPLSEGAFRISITTNPAQASSSARIQGISGRTATIRVLNVLGSQIQSVEGVTVEEGGTLVPLMVDSWPSGNYVVEGIGDEGSHASVILTVNH